MANFDQFKLVTSGGFEEIFIVRTELPSLTAASSMAISLGRQSRATLIGKPLDIFARAVLKVQDDLSSLCLTADVFYADDRFEKSSVRKSGVDLAARVN